MRISLEISFSFKSDMDGGSVVVELAEGADVISALRALARLYPMVASRIFTPEGGVRAYINVLKNGGNVRFQRGFDTLLQDGDHLAILPPVGGG